MCLTDAEEGEEEDVLDREVNNEVRDVVVRTALRRVGEDGRNPYVGRLATVMKILKEG